MRIFCDSNIIVELVERRRYFQEVYNILSLRNGNTFFISEGCVYTLAYLIDQHVRRKGVCNPQRTVMVKQQLLSLLHLFEVVHVSKDGLERCLASAAFTDIEDGFQYQAALACGAEVLLTINDKDFQDADQSVIKILTPQAFAEQYL